MPSAGTRPTSDRVREAVFGALEARDAIAGMRVLDLYAGSGALALEALSRGAGQATMVEKNAKAAAIATANAALVAKAGNLDAAATHVVCASVTSYLATSAEHFDLVFIDPPYDLADAEVTHVLELVTERLNEYGEVVCERSSRSPEPAIPPGLQLDKSKAYGETTIYWLSATPR